MASAIRIVVADNSRMSSQLLAEALRRSRNPRFEVAVPAVLNAKETVAEIERIQPHVAVLSKDFQDSPMAALGVVRGIKAAQVATKSVLLLDRPDKDVIVEAFRAGVRGLFPRSESSRLLCRCIESVHHGQIWANSQELHYLLEELERAKPLRIVDVKGRGLLSPREEQIVRLVAEGLTNRDISRQLSLSEHTVKNYLFRIFEKLGVSTRVELVLYAFSRAEAA